MLIHNSKSLKISDKVIQANITKALYLADASAKRDNNFKKNGYHTYVIAGNISQDIEVDSVSMEIADYPYHFRCCSRALSEQPAPYQEV